MKHYFYNKKLIFLISILVVLSVFQVVSLDYTDINTTLSNIFSTLIDDNEGTSSFQSLNIPSGGRAESLGTAYTALADDISFFDYNPAASSVLDYTEFAVFHNSWIADSALETISATTRYGNLGMGASIKCFYVPFSEYNIFGEKTSGNYYSETTGILNISYNFLSGYNFKGIALGMNLKGAWRSIPDYTDDNTNAIISESGLTQSAAALMIDFGMLMRFNFAKFYSSRIPNLRIGLSFLNVGTAITGFNSDSGLTLDDPLPTKIAAGISYKMIEPVTIALEFRQPLNLYSLSQSELWRAGTGIQVKITRFFSVLGGFLLKGSNPRFSLGSEFLIDKATMNVNYTLDLTSSANPVNHFSISAKMNFGDRGRKAIADKIDILYSKGLTYYAAGDMKNAIKTWQQVLLLNKRYDPAIKGIKSALKLQELYKHVLEIQNLD